MGLTYKRHFSLRKVLHRTLLTARSIAPPGLPPLCSAPGWPAGPGELLADTRLGLSALVIH